MLHLHKAKKNTGIKQRQGKIKRENCKDTIIVVSNFSFGNICIEIMFIILNNDQHETCCIFVDVYSYKIHGFLNSMAWSHSFIFTKINTTLNIIRIKE